MNQPQQRTHTAVTDRHARSFRYCRSLPVGATPTGLPRRKILQGDVVDRLRDLPSASVDTVITSPPYYMLRNYNAAGQFGQEPSVERWVENLAVVCEELARVLKPTGSLWLNLGDSYARHARYGATPKSLLLGPERLLLRLAESGWIVRNKVVWAKPNPMPTSVRDRLSSTWEPIYFLTRTRSYFFDLDRIRVPHRSHAAPRRSKSRDKYGWRRGEWAGRYSGDNSGLDRAKNEGRPGHPLGKNPGDVWEVATGGYRGAHFAPFPARLIQRPLLATTPERCCTACGTPWQRRPGQTPTPACSCGSGWRPGVVLDPFIGSGTVAVVAEAHHRDWIGLELNPAYVRLAERRIADAAGRGRGG